MSLHHRSRSSVALGKRKEDELPLLPPEERRSPRARINKALPPRPRPATAKAGQHSRLVRACVVLAVVCVVGGSFWYSPLSSSLGRQETKDAQQAPHAPTQPAEDQVLAEEVEPELDEAAFAELVDVDVDFDALNATTIEVARPAEHSPQHHSTQPKPKPKPKPRTPHRVGPRAYEPLYHGQGCSSSQLLESVASARIREDGPSRTPLDWTSNDLPPDFAFSYDLEECPPPHIFSAPEACDLLNAFGGVYIRGDSLMRHLSQGLFVLLSNSFDVLWQHKAMCRGNNVFTNKKCRFLAKFDARELDWASQFCAGGNVPPVRYQQLYSFEPEHHPDKDHPLLPLPPKKHMTGKRSLAEELEEGVEVATVELDERAPLRKRSRPSASKLSATLQKFYTDFISSLSKARQALSPVYIHGTGIHYYFESAVSWQYHIKPFAATASAAHPRPLALWVLHPAPGANKPIEFGENQGAEATLKYNGEMKELLVKASGAEKEVARGAWGVLDYYSTTDGASSFDGTHYGYQVSTERTQILLNYLDALWGEIVELGGLIE